MKKIAIMLPVGYRGGTFRASKNIAKAIAFAAAEKNQEIEVVFSYVGAGGYDLFSDFDDLKSYNISLRETEWQVFPRKTLIPMASILGLDERFLTRGNYCLPVDGANDFFDCDLWLIISDRLPAPLFPMKKFACIVFDYIQRYVPDIMESSVLAAQENTLFDFVRNAERVFATTPTTYDDVVSYAGVAKSSVSLLEIVFDPPVEDLLEDIPIDLPEQFFLWPTNKAEHKNQLNALRALEKYYLEYSGTLDVVITGVQSQEIIENLKGEDTTRFLSRVGQDLLIQKHTHLMGDLPDKVFFSLLSRCSFVWNPTLYDNGTFSVIEGAYFGKPSLSANYPAMNYLDRKFNLNLRFCDPRNISEMAHMLLEMEKSFRDIELPPQENLLEFSWQRQSEALLKAIVELI